MDYIASIGKLLCLIGVIAFLLSIIPYIRSTVANTPHQADYHLKDMASYQGWGIGLIGLGILCMLVPVVLPTLVRLLFILIDIPIRLFGLLWNSL